MRITLFDFQETALENLKTKLHSARTLASVDNPQAISFSAPTGAGKTIIMTAMFEQLLFGDEGFEKQPDAVVLWISDMPELNEQTRLKIESKSNRIRTGQLTNIDSRYDEEQLTGGNIYFINTQKLGNDKLLTKKGDTRQYSIWETFTNTAQAIPDRFYVVIDEAHRGMRTGQAENKAKTIMQRFLLGSEENSMSPMPLIVGVSATPQRFEQLLSGTTHTVHKVYVPVDEVRKSGLLKDRVLIHYPDNESHADMSLLSEAANRWQEMENVWKGYCTKESEKNVWPILVIQVEDGSGKILTKTDIATGLKTIEESIGRNFRESEVAHTFNDQGDLDISGRKIRRIEASRIEENQDIGVVLFKMSLSTGWDCPRAEVMMSFRRAEDHTYIAQLLGRMVRTPLARRIESDAKLNDVHLFLPRYNREAVDSVIHDLRNEEDVPPSETGTSRELIVLNRKAGMEDVFEASEDLVTYRVNAVRKKKALRRVVELTRGLAHDDIDTKVLNETLSSIVGKMENELTKIRKASDYSNRVNSVAGVGLKTIAFKNNEAVAEEEADYAIDAAIADIDRLFDESGKILGNGLNSEYWRAYADEDAENTVNLKVDVILLSNDANAMNLLENNSEELFEKLYEKYKRKIAKLSESRRSYYDTLRLATPDPKPIQWRLPLTIDFRVSDKSKGYTDHLYIPESDSFKADLGTWEEEVLLEELADKSTIVWLRNLEKKSWSLEIPYRVSGTIKPMFPDLIICRKDSEGYVFDILEPHDSSRSDNHPKAVGLAEFAKKHWALFGRIELIRKMKGADGKERYYRLDMSKDSVRKKVLAADTNNRLDEIFLSDSIVK